MELDLKQIIVQAVNFLVLLVVMRIFVWGKLLKFLDNRKAKIANEFRKIEISQEEVNQLRMEYQAKIESIERMANEKIKEAVQEGKKLSEELKKRAYLDAQEIVEKAKQEMKFELAKAKQELKNEIIDLTIRASESLIEEKLTEETDRRLVKTFLDKVDKA